VVSKKIVRKKKRRTKAAEPVRKTPPVFPPPLIVPTRLSPPRFSEWQPDAAVSEYETHQFRKGGGGTKRGPITKY
jgi:hypothetical protein